MNQSQKKEFFSTLQSMFPLAETELIAHNPFQLMIAVIMSAQTTDRQVNKVTSMFWDHIKAPEDIVALGLEKRMEHIQSVNFYRNKANNIYKLCETLMSKDYQKKMNKMATPAMLEIYTQYGYRIPEDLSALIQLSGIGEKTAKVLLRCIYQHPVVAVDTHVHRVANRIGLVKTKTPEQTSAILEKKIPKEYLFEAHHTIILFGRYHCIARKPKCDSCPFQSRCPT